MSQVPINDDYNVKNQAFSTFRTDLNNILAALVTNASGPSEPDTREIYQFWMDTSAGVDALKLKVYVGGVDNTWVTIGTFNTTEKTFTPEGNFDSSSALVVGPLILT